jgi:hypothetical protein
MRIDSTTNQTTLASNPANANRSSTPDSVGADSFANDQAAATGSFQPGSDFVPLLGALDRIPFIRQEVVGEVAKQLNSGELDTPQARQSTVESILGASPGHD